MSLAMEDKPMAYNFKSRTREVPHLRHKKRPAVCTGCRIMAETTRPTTGFPAITEQLTRFRHTPTTRLRRLLPEATPSTT